MLQNVLSLNISHLCCVHMPEVSVHIIVDTESLHLGIYLFLSN